MIKSFFGKFSKDIGMDLGTANVRVYVKDKGIVVHEPSVVAINMRTEQILAVGNEAKNMVGKTPGHIMTSRPLSGGVISDFEVAERMVKYFIDKVHEDEFSFVPRPRVVVTVPLGVTEVERKAVEDAIVAAGAREVFVVEEPIAAAIGARMSVEEPTGNMVVQLGAGNTQVAIISLEGIVSWRTSVIAGDELTKNIMQYTREVFGLLLGDRQAENIKLAVGSAQPLPEKIEFSMRGRDVVSGLPKEVVIDSEHVYRAISRSIATIVENIKATLEVTPPEIVADIHERGLVLSGGTALLRGIDQVIASATGIPVRIVDDPLMCVVRGTGMLLDDIQLLTRIAIPSTHEESNRKRR